jgi:hypothetical protein
VCVCVLLAVGHVSIAHAAEDELRWRSAPAEPPSPPEGVAPAPYALPLGGIGEISFWEPNRGLLITGGGGPVPAGLYAYDGASWHELSSVCGGQEGRIAWAGLDEFWTISDQRPGQAIPGEEGNTDLRSLSLCHFLDGAIVGSYALPLGEAESYQKMDSAACYSPTDCWFGGRNGFHLNWNGSTLTEVYGPEHHMLTSMAMFKGQLYESVQIDEGDEYPPYEKATRPALIHEIAPEGKLYACGEVESAFCNLTIVHKGVPLPEYGKGVLPDALQGLGLATNGSPSGAGATQMWAAASPRRYVTPPASLTVLLDDEGSWSQVLPQPSGESPLPEGVRLGGSPTLVGESTEYGVQEAIAPEPGSKSAWLSFYTGDGVSAEVAHLDSEGKLSEPSRLMMLPEGGEKVHYYGEAGPITCPAAHDCWLATESGWLYHYSDGEQIASDDDPFFDGEDGVITYRPPDQGIPQQYPTGFAEDDSLIHQQTEAAQGGSQTSAQTPSTTSSPAASGVHGIAKPLLEDVKSKVLGGRRGRMLVISFKLTARAHIQVVGRRKGKVVTRTPLESLKPGRHSLSLRLNPLALPTAIRFHATPIGVPRSLPPEPASTPGGPEAGTGNVPNVVGTG